VEFQSLCQTDRQNVKAGEEASAPIGELWHSLDTKRKDLTCMYHIGSVFADIEVVPGVRGKAAKEFKFSDGGLLEHRSLERNQAVESTIDFD
jgi:hypothetical protein